MGEKEWEPENIFDLLGDALARRVLKVASRDPRSADELAEHLDVSLPTIYRRTDALTRYNLIREQTQISNEGNHYKIFETTLKKFVVELDADGYEIDLKVDEDLVDQFEAFWGDLDQASPDVETDVTADRTIERKRSEGYDG